MADLRLPPVTRLKARCPKCAQKDRTIARLKAQIRKFKRTWLPRMGPVLE